MRSLKPATTLDKAIRPPFTFGDYSGEIYAKGVDFEHRVIDVPGYICEDENKDDRHLAHIRGWGYLGYFENGAELQDEFKAFVAEALNEHWKRKYGNV